MPLCHAYRDLYAALDSKPRLVKPIEALDAKDTFCIACNTLWNEHDGSERVKEGCTVQSVSGYGNRRRRNIGLPDVYPPRHLTEGDAVGPNE